MHNEEQIITGYPIDGAMGCSDGGRFRNLSYVYLQNYAIVAIKTFSYSHIKLPTT